ncbi:ankyrin repeat protein [Apiospora arundinis]|uniref:Ankyrin repeat protein n=1 Tax=Apiospora arundinis TaxID=335852 RepID=A0ABR2HS95_9PEZI
MSFGFSVGDFLAVIELANRIRKDFVSAPKQFQDISTELRNLEYAVRDIDVFIVGNDITDTQKKDLCGIRDSCQDVLKDCQHLLSNYSALESPAKSLKGRTTRAWQRLTSEPHDVRDLRDRITSNVTQLNRFNEGFTRDNVVRIAKVQDEFVKRQGQHDHQEILDWLTPIDFAAQQSDFIRRRQSGTGQWLLDSPEYRKWVESRKGALFCPGIPGAGKTILSSIVVDHLQDTFHGDSSIGICYLYCNFRRSDEQKLDDLLASLLKQLAQGQSPFTDSVKDLYGRRKERRTRPSTDDLSRTLHLVAATYSRVFILVDALDECTASDGCRSQLISELQKLQADLGANILATSRFIPEITARFKEAVQLEIRASESDIDTYLSGNLSHLPGFVSRNLELQAEIKQSIIKCVDGMFLLAQLHLESLKGKRSPKAVRAALKRLAYGSNAYDIAYRDAMTRINGQTPDQRLLARQTLSWVICARRPLKTVELQHALGVEPGEPDLDEENLPDLQDVVSNCCGLVTIDDESGIVRLIHYTTQEYFERTRNDWFPDAQSEITETCTTYLAFDVFESGPCQSELDFEKRLFAYPLYHYASHHWGNHAYWALNGQWWPSFFSMRSKVEAAAQGLLVEKRWAADGGYSQRFPKKMTELHIGALFGLYNVVAALMQPHNVNDPDSEGMTPLSYAAKNGHEAVVRLLLEHKAEVDWKATGKYHEGRTPLFFAASNGHEAVVRVLLQHGSEVNSKTTGKYNAGRTPLSFAAWYGHDAVVQLLLDYKAEVGAEVQHCWTPLSFAAWNGHETVVRLLLKHGSEVNSKARGTYDTGRTPLSFAASNGHETVVQLLLEHMAELDLKDQHGKTPLSFAAGNGQEAVVRLLLENKAQVDSKDRDGRTPLSMAALCGHAAVVHLLLEYMVEIDSKDQIDSKDLDGRTPLSFAASNGHISVIRLLLDYGAQPWLHDSCKRPPLFYAIQRDSVETFDLLIQSNKSEINMVDYYGSTSLSIAARFGNGYIVERILGIASVDVNIVDDFGRSPLWWAQKLGHIMIVERMASALSISFKVQKVSPTLQAKPITMG